MFYTMLNSMIMLSIVIALGFYLQKKGILNDEVCSKLTFILLNVSMPMTFFMSLQVDATQELIKSAQIIIVLSLLMHLFFLFIGFIITRILKIDKKDSGVIIFSLAFKNLTYIGLPIITSLYFDMQPAFYVTLFCIPFNILSFSLGPVLLSNNSNTKIKLTDFTTNINFSIIIGVILFLIGLKVPKPVGDAFSTIANLTIPISLLLTGALLTKTKFKTIFKDYKVIAVTFINLIILPLLFILILKPINVDPFLIEFSSVMSLLPSASLTLILTQRYNGDVDLAGKLVLTTTVFSLITVVLLSSFAFAWIN